MTPTNDAPVTWQGDDAVMPIGTTVEVLACDPAGRIENREVPARTACWIRAKIDGSAYWRYRSCDLADLGMDDATFDRLCAAVGEPELRSIVDKAIAHYDVESEEVSRASDAVEMIRRALHSHRLAALASAPAGDGVEEETDDGPCTDCYDTGVTIQTERPCSCDAAAPARPRAAVGEQSREILAATLARSIAPYAKHLAALNADDSLQVGCWIARRQIDDLILALQSPPAKVEG